MRKGGKAIKASTSTSAAKTDKKANTSQPELKRKASSSADLNAKTASTSKATSANSSKAASPADSKKSKGALGSMFAKGEEKNKAAAKEKEEKKAASSSIAKGKKKKDDEQKMDVDGEEDEYADLMADDDDLMAEIDGKPRVPPSVTESERYGLRQASTMARCPPQTRVRRPVGPKRQVRPLQVAAKTRAKPAVPEKAAMERCARSDA